MHYDYYCKTEHCQEVLRDVEQKMDDPAPKCPKCGKPMEKLFDQTTVYFRGFTTPGGNGHPRLSG
jgi:putative FmdB family regulatory protein